MCECEIGCFINERHKKITTLNAEIKFKGNTLGKSIFIEITNIIYV